MIVSIFFVPYVLFAPPIAMLGKKFGPSLVLPILMFIFGSMTLLSAAVKNFGGMMSTRWILGECMRAGLGLFHARTGLMRARARRNGRVGFLPARDLLLDDVLPSR